jgi:hypothetical protein
MSDEKEHHLMNKRLLAPGKQASTALKVNFRKLHATLDPTTCGGLEIFK